MYYAPDAHINVRPIDAWGEFVADTDGQEHFMFRDPLVAEGAQPAPTDSSIPLALRFTGAPTLLIILMAHS